MVGKQAARSCIRPRIPTTSTLVLTIAAPRSKLLCAGQEVRHFCVIFPGGRGPTVGAHVASRHITRARRLVTKTCSSVIITALASDHHLLSFSTFFSSNFPAPVIPRTVRKMSKPVQVLDNALGAVGCTPLIRLDKIAKAEGLQCNLRR